MNEHEHEAILAEAYDHLVRAGSGLAILTVRAEPTSRLAERLARMERHTLAASRIADELLRELREQPQLPELPR